MPKGVYIRSEAQKEVLRNQIRGVRPPMESLAAHYASIKGNGNPSKRPEVRAKISANRKGIPVTEERRKRIGKTRHERYGGKGDRKYSPLDKPWRHAIFVRDNFTCQICKVIGGELQVDHIKPLVLFPELRHDMNNGRTLCKSCHLKTDTHGFRARFWKETPPL